MSTSSHPLNPASFHPNRRQLLRIAGTSASALLLTRFLPGCGNSTSPASTTPTTGLKVADIKMDSLQVLSSKVVVGLDSKGIYAMSAVCTHKGCTVETSSQKIADGITCPCHGSIFDGNGNATAGPATTPLQHYKVTVAADGSISVDTKQSVDADVRVPT